MTDSRTSSPLQRRLELIDPVAVLRSREFVIVEQFLRATRRTQIGWHYICDLVWIMRQTRNWPRGGRVLDAGGGGGPAQYLLLEMGFDVTNVDLTLAQPRRTLVGRYGVRRTVLASHRPTSYLEHLSARRPAIRRGLVQRVLTSAVPRILDDLVLRAGHQVWRRRSGISARPGHLELVVGNLCHMPEIPDGHFDAVVSLSALEHIPQLELERAVQEISRVLKPGAHWAVTTSATHKPASWFHEPSKGWCFTLEDLKRYFSAEPPTDGDAAAMLEEYRRCDYLRTHLADFYHRSGNNGMPWGTWDPAYVPVGICS